MAGTDEANLSLRCSGWWLRQAEDDLPAILEALVAGLADFRFWAPLLGGFAIAWPFAFMVNRAMIRRGRGHAVVHEYHH